GIHSSGDQSRTGSFIPLASAASTAASIVSPYPRSSDWSSLSASQQFRGAFLITSEMSAVIGISINLGRLGKTLLQLGRFSSDLGAAHQRFFPNGPLTTSVSCDTFNTSWISVHAPST